ncbi:MAG: protein TolR [Gammaproteobacteria bacterium]
MATSKRRRPMSEINVVPYIDVMLVLLVIFMITAPLLSQGVKVELPQAAAEPIQADQQEPLVVTVDVDGNYFLNIGEDQDEGIDHETLVQRVAAVLRHQPGTNVLVRGDKDVNYGKVVTAMALLQNAGAPSVGLLTDAPESVRKK